MGEFLHFYLNNGFSPIKIAFLINFKLYIDFYRGDSPQVDLN